MSYKLVLKRLYQRGILLTYEFISYKLKKYLTKQSFTFLFFVCEEKPIQKHLLQLK